MPEDIDEGFRQTETPTTQQPVFDGPRGPLLVDYWKTFLRDVLWKTLKRAIAYSVLLSLVFLILAVFVLGTAVPAQHSTSRKLLEGVLLFVIYVVGGGVCGFLLGVSTLHAEVARIVDAVYQTIRGMIMALVSKSGGGSQLIPADQLRRFMESGTGAWIANFSQQFGAAKRLFAWVVSKPLELLRAGVLNELLPSIGDTAISATAVEDYVKKRLVQMVQLPLQAKLRAVQYSAWAIGITAFVLPIVMLKIR